MTSKFYWGILKTYFLHWVNSLPDWFRISHRLILLSPFSTPSDVNIPCITITCLQKTFLLLRNSEKYRRFFWKLSQFARNNFLQNIFQMCCKCILVLIGVVITFVQVVRVSSFSLSCWMFFLRIQKNMGLEIFVKYFLALRLALRLDFALPFIPSRTLPLFRNNRTYCPAMLS